MPRFVLLLHDCPDGRPRATHCDLMLEVGSALRTWALAQVPHAWSGLDLNDELLAASDTVDADRLADHRLTYLEYEGPISGGRGHVRRLDQGSYCAGLSPSTFSLQGRILQGEVEILPPAEAHESCQLTYRSASSAAASVRPSI